MSKLGNVETYQVIRHYKERLFLELCILRTVNAMIQRCTRQIGDHYAIATFLSLS